jgi:predicted component of type VI protein secretion system
MKDILGRINPNDVICPVQALAVESVEHSNSFTIALSRSSFTLEYQQLILGVLAKYQEANHCYWRRGMLC